MKKKPTLWRVNRLYWQILIFPLFTLLYAPVNRYIMLPRFGGGEPYVNMSGEVVTEYFSANTVAKCLFYLLLTVTAVLSFMHAKQIERKMRRVPFVLLCLILDIAGGILFLEFTLWG